MRLVLFSILLIIIHSIPLFAQPRTPKTINYKGETYFHYPEIQQSEEKNFVPYDVYAETVFKKHNIDTNKVDGKWIQFYSDGKIAKIFELIGTMRTGIWKAFYRNGNLAEKGNYEGWFMIGSWKYYYPSGSIRAVENHTGIMKEFWNGIGIQGVSFTGKQIYYHENGKIDRVEFYDDESEKTGKWREYYENGLIKKEEIYEDNLINGYAREWDENGNLLSRYKYENGSVAAIWKSRVDIIDQKDSTIARGYLWDNLKAGKWQEFYQGGNIKSEGNYRIDNLYYCGEVPFDIYYSYKTGEWVYTYENGKLKARGTYITKKVHLPNNCEGGTERYMSYVTDKWEFRDENGNKVTKDYLIKRNIFKEIEHNDLYDFFHAEE